MPNGPNIDIVAIHDLDETLDTAWISITTQRTKTSKDNDLGSKRGSIERNRQQPKAQASTTEGTKKGGGSTKDDPIPDFKDGKITREGILKKVDGWELGGADSSAVTEGKDPAAPGTLLSQAGSSNGPPQQDEPRIGEASTSRPSNGPPQQGEPRVGETSTSRQSNVLSQQDAPRIGKTGGAGPSTNESKTKATSSGEDKIAKSEIKRTKSSGKTKGKGISDPPLPPPQASKAAPPKHTLHEPGVSDGGASKEIRRDQTPESRKRHSRPPTEVDGSERKRQVHLFRDPNMIPGAFPGARILSYTYPGVPSTAADEYIEKVAEKLLKNLKDERRKIPTKKTVPIIFVGSGFGGLVLQKLLVLAGAEVNDKKDAEADQILSMNAGFVFLDTPFPATQQDGKTENFSFPSGCNARQENIMRRLKESGTKFDSGILWNTFDKKREVIQDQKLPIVWLYTGPSIAKDSSKVRANAVTLRRTRS